MRILRALIPVLFLIACTTAPPPKETPPDPTYDLAFQKTMSEHTRFYRKYDGFYESFRAHATMVTPEVQMAIATRRAQLMNWDQKKIALEREKAQQEMAAQSKIFLQFYAPETDYDDLNKINSIWHVYLEIDGRRFEGKIQKVKGKPIELAALHSEFDRFSTPYEITFNISTNDTIRHEAKLVLASTLGEAIFKFEPAN
jgi:hypothetical protein